MDPPKSSFKMLDHKKKKKNVDPFKNLFLASQNQNLNGISVIIHTCPEIQCLLYVGFFNPGKGQSWKLLWETEKDIGEKTQARHV